MALGVFLALSSGPAKAATTFTVNKTGDAEDRKLTDAKCDTSTKKGNQCTLRAALEESNDTSGEDTIKFKIGDTSSVKTISPASELPIIEEAVTINGYTQRGASENTLEEGNDAVLKVELDGTNAESASGLRIDAADSTIKGLVINRFSGSGISINGAGNDGNRIEGNFIGTNVAGTADQGNNSTGVSIGDQSADNIIGGTQPAQRNVISGNGGAGVLINGSSATGNSVLSNSIFANDGLGIDLNNDGVTANDTDDPDTGENNLQNFPTINLVTTPVPGFTSITGTLNSNPNEGFIIQCFLSEETAVSSGNGEGAVLLDTTVRTTGPLGNANFQCDSTVPEAGQEVTATATKISSGDTSEFSQNVTIP